MIAYYGIQDGISVSLYFELTLLLFFISIFSSSRAVYALHTVGMIIPLYADTGNEWKKVIHAKNTHKSVPILVIINPNNGPSACPSHDYMKEIMNLKSAGIIILGYVSTNYTARNNGEVITDIDNWKRYYPDTDGIFFDEMANIPGKENYYVNLTSYAKSLGFAITVGNPGINTLSSYVGTVDNLVIYEDTGFPNLSSLGGWCTSHNKNHFSIISYGVNEINDSTIRNLSHHVGYLFITNGTLPNPFTSLPPYFGQIVEELAKYNYEKNKHDESMT